MDFTNAVKILELNIGKDKFLSLPEIEKQYRKLVKIYHPDLYVNDKKKYKWAQEKMKVINDAIEFVRNNYEDIKMKHEIKNAEEYEKAVAKRRAQKNEERKMREQEEAIRKEKFKYEEEIRRKEQKKKEEEERARREEEKRKEEEDRIKKEKLMEERRIKKEKRKEFIKKYKWLIILFILLTIGVLVYLYGNRNATEYDKATGIKETGKYKNFKRDGLWTIYYEDGSYEERYYKDGTLDKEIIKYNINGVIIKKITVIDGKKEGKCIEYDSNGNIVFECFYKDDELDGTFKRYSNNKVILEENYKNGILDGKFTLFSNSGKIIIDGFYKDGKREGEWSYNNLQELLQMKDLEYIFSNEYEYLFSLIQKDVALTEFNTLYEFIENNNYDVFNIKGSFKNGLKEGEWEFYTYINDIEGGELFVSKFENEKINLYKDDKLVRLLLEKYSYVEDGEKFKSEIFYENGKMRQKLYQNNYLFLEGDDFDNNKSGKITEFYNSGKISTIIDWKESIEEIGYGNEAYGFRRIVGKAKKFYENGKLFGEGEVRDYPLEGGIVAIGFNMDKKWKYYNQNGKLILEGEYKIAYDNEDAVYEACYRIGEWNYYYDNGMIRAKGYYSGTGNNKYNSYWEFFDTDGNLEKKIEVEELHGGVGYTIKYYEDGYIINEENLRYIYSNKHADDLNYDEITDLLHVEGSCSHYKISDKIKLFDEKDIKKQLEE